MKQLLQFLFLLFAPCMLPAQNVGVGTTTPQEKLDVNGNINVSGTIKVNGTDGTAGQVLMKNNSGNLVWGESSQYKNVIGFPSGSSTLTNTIHSWTVPTGVTKILVEAWGGGGGGAVGGGGGGGGYAAVEWTVTPGANVSITIGAAGAGATSSSIGGSYGNNTTVIIGGAQLTVYGGGGGYTNGGGFPGRWGVNASTLNPYGQSGAPGEATSETYGQYNSTTWYTAVQFGSGGQGGNTSLANKNGGFRSFNNASTTVIENNYGQIGSEPGGGGGGQYNGGRYGAPGLVFIHF